MGKQKRRSSHCSCWPHDFILLQFQLTEQDLLFITKNRAGLVGKTLGMVEKSIPSTSTLRMTSSAARSRAEELVPLAPSHQFYLTGCSRSHTAEHSPPARRARCQGATGIQPASCAGARWSQLEWEPMASASTDPSPGPAAAAASPCLV